MQTIKIISNGRHTGTKVFVDEKQIKFASLQISGDQDNDYDIVLGLTMSQLTKEQIKQQGGCVPAVGFQIPNDEYFEEDEE